MSQLDTRRLFETHGDGPWVVYHRDFVAQRPLRPPVPASSITETSRASRPRAKRPLCRIPNTIGGGAHRTQTVTPTGVANSPYLLPSRRAALRAHPGVEVAPVSDPHPADCTHAGRDRRAPGRLGCGHGNTQRVRSPGSRSVVRQPRSDPDRRDPLGTCSLPPLHSYAAAPMALSLGASGWLRQRHQTTPKKG